jgi:N6-L-threonylcarbamoyladenine synthase
VEKDAGQTPQADVAASYQAAIVEVLTEKLRRAARETGIRTVCVAGGVAANRGLKAALEAMAEAEGLRLVVPAPIFCTDNAAMIAAAGYFRLQRHAPDDLAFDTYATEPLAAR